MTIASAVWQWLSLGLASVVIAAVWVPYLPSRQRWVRMWDYPRGQCMVLLVLTLPGCVFWIWSHPGWLAWTAGGLWLASLVALGWEMRPYTPLARKQCPTTQGNIAADRRLRVLSSNVLMDNRSYDRLLALVEHWKPDILVLLEVDAAWMEGIRILDERFAERYVRAQDNRYGMALYSRFPVVAGGMRSLLRDDLPSAKIRVRLPSQHEITVYALHPPPPAPGEAPTSIGRDAEMALIAEEVRADSGPAIVIGDLNDVAWSHGTRLFQRLSATADPRVGRGVFSTFHAGHWWMRWPLDHIFVTSAFSVVDLRVCESVGSDHFPVCCDLALEDGHPSCPPPPRPDDEREVAVLLAQARRDRLPLTDEE